MVVRTMVPVAFVFAGLPAVTSGSPGLRPGVNAARQAAATPRRRAEPTTVVAGRQLTLIGSNFKRSEIVRFYVGPPRAGAQYWGSTRAGVRGGFRKVFRVNPSVGPGTWVVVACQRGCRIKASASFHTRRAAGRG